MPRAPFLLLLGLSMHIAGCRSVVSRTERPPPRASPEPEVAAELTRYQAEGFSAPDDVRWSEQERKAVAMTWEEFRAHYPIRSDHLIPRFKVEHYNGYLVTMVWVAWGEDGRPLIATLGGSVYTVQISSDFSQIKVLPSA